MGDLKAWTVCDRDHEGCVVVYAETRGKARYAGSGEIDEEFLKASVRRSPEFDQYAATGKMPPDEALVKAGWWTECYGRGCYKRITQSMVDDGEAEFVDGTPYCKVCAEKAKAGGGRRG